MAKTIAFLNDTSDWYHWGCTGTSEAIKHILTARGHHILPVAITTLAGVNPPPKDSADFDSPEFFRTFFHANPDIARPILKSDVVVFNGEGTMHGLSRMPLQLLYIAYASKKFCQKPVQVINHSCYPDSGQAPDPNSPASTIYRGVYRVLDYVAIREKHSAEVMRLLGINPTLSFDCLPLYIRDHYTSPTSPRKPVIVIAGSVFWRPESIPHLTSYIKSMQEKGFQVIVLTGARAYSARDDGEFVKALKEAMPAGWTHVEASSIKEWLDTIASAALLVSGRFHYTIAACVLGTPCVVLGTNTDKNLALCEEAGLPAPLSYATEDFEQELYKRTDIALKAPALDSSIRDEWCRRAMLNFEQLQ